MKIRKQRGKEGREGGKEKEKLISSISLSYSGDMSQKDDTCLKKLYRSWRKRLFFWSEKIS